MQFWQLQQFLEFPALVKFKNYVTIFHNLESRFQVPVKSKHKTWNPKVIKKYTYGTKTNSAVSSSIKYKAVFRNKQFWIMSSLSYGVRWAIGYIMMGG